MGAMPEEILAVIDLLDHKQEHKSGGRSYFSGTLNGIPAYAVISGWGKVAAAATISTLIYKFNITELIFTGVAGAISPKLSIGDIVLATRLMQHDMDARPFIPQYEIPQLGRIFLNSPLPQMEIAKVAIQNLLADRTIQQAELENNRIRFGITNPELHLGDIASGDKFFSNTADKRNLLAGLPSILCVEMEGAAVAQVCFENDIPFTIIRTISDRSDDHSVADFSAFIKEVASRYSLGIIRNIFANMN